MGAVLFWKSCGQSFPVLAAGAAAFQVHPLWEAPGADALAVQNGLVLDNRARQREHHAAQRAFWLVTTSGAACLRAS